ncbi:MAG: cobalt transport protein CbiN [Clostridiales bacterium]
MSKMGKINWLLLIIAIAIFIVPFFMYPGMDMPGADDQGADLIGQINSDFEPIMKSIFEPASDQMEGLLFALQTAIGAGVLGFTFGRITGKK